MRLKSFLGLALLLVAVHTIVAQAPQRFNYQAVARNSNGNVIASQAVGMQISLRQITATGAIVYTETHTVTTSAAGLMNLSIGGGTVTTGDFSTIDWSAGPYFIEIGMDATGGTSYLTMGTQQLLSVPFALFAAKSGDGPTGPQGIQGPAGTNGSNGVDGASFLSGSGVPAAATGSNGDTYVNLTDGATYLKASGTWTATGNNIKGPQGITGNIGTSGSNGASFLSGSGVPASATGSNGDTYVNLADGATYLKTSGTWSATGNNIKGPQGIIGNTGTSGSNGASFLSGSGIPASATGSNGDTYVDLADGATYLKTSGTWSATGNNIKGPQGITGNTGTSGSNGASFLSGSGVPASATGSNGDTYVNLADGATYLKTSGTWSATGNNIKGPQGIIGNTGSSGSNGASFLSGSGVPAAAIGSNGDTYVNLADGATYLKASGAWTATGNNIKGPQGTTGATGASFLQGTVVPATALGNDGDVYVNTATGNIYKKVSGSWGSATGNIWGPTTYSGYIPASDPTGKPPVGTGLTGDSYIDFNTGKMFKKTSATTWSFSGYTGGPETISDVRVVYVDYYLDPSDGVIYSSLPGITYYLPLASSVPKGKIYYITGTSTAVFHMETSGGSDKIIEGDYGMQVTTTIQRITGTYVSDGTSYWIEINHK